MSSHWLLALRYSSLVLAVAVVVGGLIWARYGQAHAGAFGYGTTTGLISLLSTAVTVSLLMGRSMAAGIMIGGASFAARYGFAAAVLGIPAYFGLWPVVPMLIGFAGVYLAENVFLLPGVFGMMSNPGARRSAQEARE